MNRRSYKPFLVYSDNKVDIVQHRSFLKWAGGKYRLVAAIRQYLPQKRCLIEPFAGSASIFLNTDFERYLLSDINPDLINLFNTIKNDVDEYVYHCRLLFHHQHANSKAFYYENRKRFNSSEESFERAVIFLYLNRFGYNGLCRYNKQHQYNVPFGNYVKHYFPEQELYYFAEKAQKAEFFCLDFEEVFRYAMQHSKDSVIYCDPPYAPLKQNSNFTQYSGGGFSLTQQKTLAQYALQAANQGIPVLISNHDTHFTREIYQGASITKLKVQRSIGHNASSRGKVDELLALFS